MSERGITVRSIDDVERLARIAVASGFTACRKHEEAAVILMTGHELGLSPMQSLRGIYVVKGKPMLSADLMVAVVRASGLCESWRVVESTPERCTITTRRKGEPHDASRTWTMGDAKRAGLLTNGTWTAYPATMLRHRCAADLARQEYPDVIMGLYDPEEFGGEPAPTPEEIPALASLGIEQRPTLPAGPSAVDAWLTDLAAVGSVHELPAAYQTHAQGLSDAGHDGRSDVRAWLRARGLCAVGDEVTAVVSTMPKAMLRALDVAHLLAGEDPEPTPDVDALVRAARAWRRATADDHSRGKAWNILARSYGAAQNLAPRQAGPALKAASEEPEPDPTGTDGAPSREPGEDDGADPAGFDAARSAQGEARAELRVVRDESSDPCVTSAAAWREHLATLQSKWHVCGSFRKRASAFAAEGEHTAREEAALARLRELGEAAPRTLLHSMPAPRGKAKAA